MKQRHSVLISILLILGILAGCASLPNMSMLTPVKKPDVGPTGAPVDAKPNPPFWHRFLSPPTQLYDLEAIAGSLFKGVNKERWEQAQSGLTNLQNVWDQTKPLLGDMKGVDAADSAMTKLSASVAAREVTASYENLIAFMAAISDIGKSFKLSPLSDIVAVGNTARNVAFYTEDKNWLKTASKVKELEGTWKQVRPSMEQIGIFGELTQAHSLVKELKDAVNAENKSAIEEKLANLNESMGRIRQFYYGNRVGGGD